MSAGDGSEMVVSNVKKRVLPREIRPAGYLVDNTYRKGEGRARQELD